MGNAQAGQFDIPTTGTNEAPRREPPRCDELVKYVKTELIEWKKILQTVKKTKSEKDGEFLKERLTETAKKINDMFQVNKHFMTEYHFVNNFAEITINITGMYHKCFTRLL